MCHVCVCVVVVVVVVVVVAAVVVMGGLVAHVCATCTCSLDGLVDGSARSAQALVRCATT